MNESTRLVYAEEIEARLNVCGRTFTRMIQRGDFPKPLRLNIRRRAWAESVVEAYFAHRIAESMESISKPVSA